MQYKRSIKSLAAIVLVSFILAECGISVDKNKLLGELSDCYPEDTFTFEEMNPVGIITVTSELYPDETILLQSKDDVTESTYPGKVYKDYVDGFFTDLAGECFEGCGIDISWVGRTKFYPIEEINREEFMERYVYDGEVWIHLFYSTADVFPDNDSLRDSVIALVDELDAPCSINIGIYADDEDPSERQSDVVIRVVADRADHIETIDIERTGYVYENEG